jgi:hypothetical protein
MLTTETSKSTFGMRSSEYQNFKGLAKKNQNLQDGTVAK